VSVSAPAPTPDNPLLEAALGYASHGRKVFPLWWPIKNGCSCSQGLACVRAGKHPLAKLAPNGLHDATDDPDVIRGWWAQYPEANIGIRTGPESGFWVLDVDAYKGGAIALEELEAKHRQLPTSIRARTGSGGASTHVIFLYPTNLRIASRALPGVRGLDVKGAGGYIVAPPSLHRSGNRYCWLDEEDSQLEEAPGWLLAMVGAPPSTAPTSPIPTGLELTEEDAAEFCEAFFARAAKKVSGGEARHDTAVWLWTQFKDNGVPLDAAASWVSPYLDLCREEGADRAVPEDEIRRICAWAYSKPRRDPLRSVAKKLALSRQPAAPAELPITPAPLPAAQPTPPAPASGPIGSEPKPGPNGTESRLEPESTSVFPWIDLDSFRGELRIVAQTRRPTGIPSLDKAFKGGLPGGVVCSMVGPAGSCKSVLAVQIGIDRAIATDGVLYVYSPDQGGNQPLERLGQRFGDLVDDDGAFGAFLAEYGDRIRVADESNPGVTLESFEKAVLEAGNAAAVVIDTPQTVLTKSDDDGERAKIDAAMSTSRSIAKKLLIPVLVPQHANRAATAARKREDRNSELSAGAGSGKIEHRSQVLLFMEAVENLDHPGLEVNVTIAKVSFGSKGRKFRLRLDTNRYRLEEVDAVAAHEIEEARAAVDLDRRTRETGEKIVRFLRRFPEGASGRAIREGIGGKTADFQLALRRLHESFVIFGETRSGKGGGIAWKLGHVGNPEVRPNSDGPE
jgi:KaiC/GvpD/RAD55 family RecA-like ATPase